MISLSFNQNTITITDFVHYVNITITEEELKKNQTLLSFLDFLRIKIENSWLTIDDIIQQEKEKK